MAEHDTVLAMIRQKNQKPITLHPKRTALLVIDMQRYFVRPHYPFGQVIEKLAPGATAGYFERVNATVVPNINRLQACFRALEAPIFYTAAGSWIADGRDLPPWMQEYDEVGQALLGQRIWPPVGDQSWEVDESVAPLPHEVVLNKPSSGTFTSTPLGQTLHTLKIESVIVTGVTTDVCVGLGAREAADRGYQTIIASDACTTFSAEMHQANLDAFCLAFGRVRSTEEIVRLMSTATT
jgi:nicotinamidase-related amidase